jgi:hypothetical protein
LGSSTSSLLLHRGGSRTPLRGGRRMRNSHRYQSMVIFGTGSTGGGRSGECLRCLTSVSARHNSRAVPTGYRTLQSDKAAFREDVECMTASTIQGSPRASRGCRDGKSGLELWTAVVRFGPMDPPRISPQFIFSPRPVEVPNEEIGIEYEKLQSLPQSQFTYSMVVHILRSY